MTQPIMPPFIPAAEPTLKDLFDAHTRDILLSTNCHAIATVQSFAPPSSVPGLPKLTATMNYTKSFTVVQPNGEFVNQQQTYPALVDCPVIVLGGGTAALQQPISQGDQCLILFNDRDLTAWWASPNGAASALPTSRLHSFSDAIALVGFSQWQLLDSIRMLLTNGNVSSGINPQTNKVTIQNVTDGTLGTSLGNLITILTTFLTACESSSTDPILAAAATTAVASLTADQVATKIAGILE